MAQLSWGKPTIEIGLLGENDAVPTTWIKLPTPVKDSSKLTPTKGTKLEAPLEGGGNEDVKYSKNTYTFEFELYAKKGREKPIEDNDGVVEGHYALRLTPEDPTVEGILIDKSTVSVEDSWDANIGSKWKYTLDVLEPNDGGKAVKPYKASSNPPAQE